MSNLEVFYDDQKVGTLAETAGGIVFEYDPGFIAAGHELSPLHLPLQPGLRRRTGGLNSGLHGLFEDSLPGLWGERLMFDWFRRRGTHQHSVTPLMKLAYIGGHGMGALSYRPELESAPTAHDVSLHDLHEAVTQAELSRTVDLDMLAEVGSSAGGAHPKALIGLPVSGSGPVVAGAGELPPTHDAWLIKFDTGRDAVGVLEHAYALMARAAGIDMPPTQLLETRHGKTVRRHFAVKRFDRDGGERIHHHTLAGMYQMPGCDLDYETLLRVTRRITRDEQDVLRAYRRAAFNVLASNRDDHGANHGFLYRHREWRLGPAYDVTFRGPGQLAERGMSICGERKNAGRQHLMKLAESEAVNLRAAEEIIANVIAAIGRWRELADEGKVPAAIATDVAFVLNSAAGRTTK